MRNRMRLKQTEKQNENDELKQTEKQNENDGFTVLTLHSFTLS